MKSGKCFFIAMLVGLFSLVQSMCGSSTAGGTASVAAIEAPPVKDASHRPRETDGPVRKRAASAKQTTLSVSGSRGRIHVPTGTEPRAVGPKI